MIPNFTEFSHFCKFCLYFNNIFKYRKNKRIYSKKRMSNKLFQGQRSICIILQQQTRVL